MRVLVCSSRDWGDGEIVLQTLRVLKTFEVVIEGEAPGADTSAREAAEQLGIPMPPFPTDWGRYGRAAEPMRNHRMLDEGRPEIVSAFTENLN